MTLENDWSIVFIDGLPGFVIVTITCRELATLDFHENTHKKCIKKTSAA
jgi:hypothetical protein